MLQYCIVANSPSLNSKKTRLEFWEYLIIVDWLKYQQLKKTFISGKLRVYGILMVWPALILSDDRPFALFIFATVVPCLLAIELRVSPFLIL